MLEYTGIVNTFSCDLFILANLLSVNGIKHLNLCLK